MPDLIVVSGRDVDHIISQPDTLEAALNNQRQLFQEYYKTKSETVSLDGPRSIQNPHRLTLETSRHKALFMPSRYATASDGTSGCKIVCVPTQTGDASGLPASTLVLDEANGSAKGIVNARTLTALRNACGSALFCERRWDFESPDGPSKLVVFGSGEQARTHAMVLSRCYTSIKSIRVVARHATPRLQQMVRDLAAVTKIEISAITTEDHTNPDIGSALLSADIIVTCTPSTEPLFSSSNVPSGAVLCLIGSYQPHMQEIDQDLVRRAAVIAVDSIDACLKEAGELIMAKLEAKDLVELGQLLSEGTTLKGLGAPLIYKSVRSYCQFCKLGAMVNQPASTVFHQVGIGIQDVAIATCILDIASQLDLGTKVIDYD